MSNRTEPPAQNETKVLHLDDDSVDHILLTKNIKKINPEITLQWFATGEEAMMSLSSQEYHCIICDYQMPDIDGMEFLLQLREENNHLPFIFYTGQGNELVAAEAFRNGADDYYSKDEGFAHYHRIAASILKNSRAYRNRKNYEFAINALRKSDERLFLAGKAVQDLMYDWDLVNDHINWFGRFEEALGYEKGEVDDSMEGWAGLLHPDDRKWLLPQLENDKKNGKILSYEYRMKAKDGSYRHWRERGYPQKNSRGEIVRWVGVCKDITYPKELEEKLEYNLDTLEETQKMANLGTYRLDFKSGLWESSQLLDEILGIPPNFEKTIDGWLQLVHSDDKERMRDHLQNYVIAKGNPFEAEYRIVRPDTGKTIWLHGVGKIYQDKAGTTATMIGAIRDITANKESESRLLKENSKLMKILDSMPVLIDAFDDKGNIIYWNKECERVTGYSSKEMCHNPDALAILYPNESNRAKVIKTLEEAKENLYNMDFTLTSKDGEEKTIFWSNVSHQNPIEGWLTWAVGYEKIPSDDTKAHISQLQNSMEQAEKLTKMGSWTWNLETLDNFWTPGMYAITERPVELGPTSTVQEWLELIHPEDRNRVMNNIDKMHNRKSVLFSDEFRLVSASGRIKDIRLKGKTVLQGEHIGMVYGTIIDVTKQKTAERELDLAYKKLQISNRDLKTFSYTVSHDLKAPIRRVAGFIDILKTEIKQFRNAEIDQTLDYIYDSCCKMNRLIDNIINFSVSQDKKISRTEVNLSLLVTKAIERLSQDAPERKYDFNCQEEYLVSADEELLKMLVNNLTSNAWKYTIEAEKASIILGQENIKGENYYFISDNGIGMDQESAAKAFQPFARLSSGLDVDGSGIGLATVKRIVEAHGGDIFIQSERGKGTTIYFYL